VRPLETKTELPELLLASTQTLTMTLLLVTSLHIALAKTELKGNVSYRQGEAEF
jgi:hypothetical protein